MDAYQQQRQTSFLPDPITGYAAVFYDGTPGTEFELPGGVRERISRSAFDRAVHEDDVVGLFNHDLNQLLGRTSAGTLRLSIDSRGLRYDIEPGETTLHSYVSSLQKRGDLTGSSFGFNVKKQSIRKDGDIYVRELEDVELFDVGPVVMPAYEATANGRSYRGVGMDGRPLKIPDNQETRSLSRHMIDQAMVEVRWLQLQEANQNG